MSEVGLRLEGICKSFGNLQVLNTVFLDVEQGELVTLLGPSGCGKSTTLNIVAGLLNADRGNVILRGKIVNNLPPQKRKVGMVFQSWALFPHMTVYENIAFGLQQRKWPRNAIRQRVAEMLALVRLQGVEDKYPSQLSGGMRQRVAFARALAVEPDILLLDEPFSNLDELLRREMEVETRNMQQELGITTLFVTHNQEEALVMSDKVAVMFAGKIVEFDTPHNVYNYPKTPFVCRFLGDANVLDGEVIREEENYVIVKCGSLRFVVANSATSVGQKVRIAFRPERVIIGRGANRNRNDQPNLFHGRVKNVVYKGVFVHCSVTIGELETDVIQQCLNPEEIVNVDEEVYVYIPKEAILLYKMDKTDG
ncbi:MAG: ABC transporter ATP-binding protein [Candidatus Methanomethyliaceae archaeon]